MDSLNHKIKHTNTDAKNQKTQPLLITKTEENMKNNIFLPPKNLSKRLLSPVCKNAPALQPPTLQPPTLQPPTLQPPTLQPPILQPPTLQPPTLQPPTLQPPTLQPPTLQPPTLTRHHENHLIVGRLVLLMTRDVESLVLTLEEKSTTAYFRSIKSLPPNPIDPSQLWEFRPKNASADTWFLFHPQTGSAVIKGDEFEVGGMLRCHTFQGTPNGNDDHTYVSFSWDDQRMTGTNYQAGYFYYGRDESNNLTGYFAGSLASRAPANTFWASTYYD